MDILIYAGNLSRDFRETVRVAGKFDGKSDFKSDFPF